jgi:glycosyltransferase involved in cell wall biosynthesis
VYDGHRFLREAVDSILGQTLTDLELVIVDDGSAETTKSLLRALATSDERIRVLERAHEGLAAALNAGLEEAHAGYVARMDADDVSSPDRLARQLELLDANPAAALVAGGVALVDEAGRQLDIVLPPQTFDLLNGNTISHPTVVFRTDAVRDAGGYRLDQAEDYDLWLRLEERHSLASFREPVLRYRLHEGQFSVRRLRHQAIGALVVREAARRRRGGGGDPLNGVARVDEARAVLGVGDADVQRQVVADALYWATVLRRAGRREASKELIKEAADGGRLSVAKLRLVANLRLLRWR